MFPRPGDRSQWQGVSFPLTLRLTQEPLSITNIFLSTQLRPLSALGHRASPILMPWRISIALPQMRLEAPIPESSHLQLLSVPSNPLPALQPLSLCGGRVSGLEDFVFPFQTPPVFSPSSSLQGDWGLWVGVSAGWVRNLALLLTSGACYWRRKWQPTPVFLAGESQGQRSLLGCRLWGRTELDTTDET